MANVIDAGTLAVYVGAGETKVACSTNATLTVSQATRDVTCKDTSGWRGMLTGLKSWTISTEGLFKYDVSEGAEDMLQHLLDGELVILKFSTEVSGESYVQGSGYASEVSWNAPNAGENATWSVTFEGTGALTTGEN